jgi:hypothetical protein
LDPFAGLSGQFNIPLALGGAPGDRMGPGQPILGHPFLLGLRGPLPSSSSNRISEWGPPGTEPIISHPSSRVKSSPGIGETDIGADEYWQLLLVYVPLAVR